MDAEIQIYGLAAPSKEKQEQCWLLCTYVHPRTPSHNSIPSECCRRQRRSSSSSCCCYCHPHHHPRSIKNRTAASADRPTYNTIPARRSFRLGRFNEYDAAASSAWARAREADIDRERLRTYQSEWYYYDDDDDELGDLLLCTPDIAVHSS